MIKVIKPAQKAIVEYHCDGCEKNLEESDNVLDTGIHIVGDFGSSAGDLNGVIFDVMFCSTCGRRIIDEINKIFPNAITSGKGIEWESESDE